MEARLQRRVQRYGWDLAAQAYEALWQAPLAGAQQALLAAAALAPGEAVLDVACGTGLVSFAAARAVGPQGKVLGVDLSSRMVDAAGRRVRGQQLPQVGFARMDAGFDAALCALGLMYLPDPAQALREMRRVLRPGGRVALCVWGERSRCGWSSVFPIADAEVASDVCPLFFQLGQPDALARLCAQAGFEAVQQRRIAATLAWANADDACEAVFVGGPVALAWAHFSEEARDRVRRRYLDAIAPWRDGGGYRVPGEFVIVSAATPGPSHAPG